MKNNLKILLSVFLASFHINAVQSISSLTWNDPVDLAITRCDLNDDSLMDAQGDLEQIINQWVADNHNNIDPTGGCSEISLFNDYVNQSVDLCNGGDITITWTIADSCETRTTSAIFTLNQQVALTWNEATDLTVHGCDFSDQTELDDAFISWLISVENQADVQGGCDPIITNDFVGNIPQLCNGGSIIINFTISDLCQTESFDAVFTLNSPSELFVDSVEDFNVDACNYDSQAELEGVFYGWMALIESQIFTNGDCITYISNDFDGNIPHMCSGGFKTIIFTVSNNCEFISFTSTFTVDETDISEPVFDIAPADLTLTCDQAQNYIPDELYYTNGLSGSCEIYGTVVGQKNGDFENCLGPYSVSWLYTEKCGYSIIHVQNISILNDSICEGIELDVNISGSDFCAGGSTVLTSSSDYSSYQWSTGATTQSIIVIETGTYSVTVTDEKGCIGSEEIAIFKLEDVNPVINVSYGICTGELSILEVDTYDTFLWSTGETTQSIEVVYPGLYSVSVTDNGCEGVASINYISPVFDTVQIFDTTFIEVIETIFDTIQIIDTTFISVTDTLIINLQTTGNDNVNISGKIKIYPNPSNSIVTLSFKEYEDFNNYEIIIINSAGLLSYSKVIDQEILNIPIEEIGPPGSYIIQFFDDLNRLLTTKVLILFQ